MELQPVERGAIRNRGRYFQGFDHSSWNGVLPNKITPSDIDVVFDCLRLSRHLFCDFTTAGRLWSDKPYGQRILYSQLLRTNNYANASVLCYHSVPTGRSIDSLKDVESFHVMRIKDGVIKFYPDSDKYFVGALWVDFVKCFYGLESSWSKW